MHADKGKKRLLQTNLEDCRIFARVAHFQELEIGHERHH